MESSMGLRLQRKSIFTFSDCEDMMELLITVSRLALDDFHTHCNVD